MESVLLIGEHESLGIVGSYTRAFRALGMDVQHYRTSEAFERAFPGAGTRVIRRLFEPIIVRRFNRTLVKQLQEATCDLAFVVKGRHLRAETIDELRNVLGCPVINFYPDDPFSQVRSNRLVFGPSVLAHYDACFTFARHLISRYREAGAENTHYLPFARDPHLHAPPEKAQEPSHDVVFVGNLDAERVRWLEPIVTAGFSLIIYGERTREAVPYASPLRDASFCPAVYGQELAQAIHRGRISLNVMRKQNRKSHNMRSFESPSCGAFTLSQWTPELVELFDENEEQACFRTPEALCEQVEYWLAHPAKRRGVAEAGFRRVKDDTYCRRAETILRKMSMSVAD